MLLVIIVLLYYALDAVWKLFRCSTYQSRHFITYTGVNLNKEVIREILLDIITSIKINSSDVCKTFKKLAYNERESRTNEIKIKTNESSFVSMPLTIIPSDPINECLFDPRGANAARLKYFSSLPQTEIIPDRMFKDTIISNQVMRCFTRFLYDQIRTPNPDILSVLLNERDSSTLNLTTFSKGFSQPEQALWKSLIAEYGKLVAEIKKKPNEFDTAFTHEIISKICYMVIWFNRLNWPLFYTVRSYTQEFTSFDEFCSNVSQTDLLAGISNYLGCCVCIYEKNDDGQTHSIRKIDSNNMFQPRFELLFDKASRTYKLCRTQNNE